MDADCALCERLAGLVEALAPGAGAGDVARASAAGRALVAARVEALEKAEASGDAAAAAAADALDSVGVVWRLCEACLLDAPEVRAPRLAAWLAGGVDAAAEDAEYAALAPLLLRVDAPAEHWTPDGAAVRERARTAWIALAGAS